LKTYRLKFIVDAEQDLDKIIDYINEHDGEQRAMQVLDQIIKKCEKLKRFPERGRIPEELRNIGQTDFREVFYKPYRIIYQILGKEVYVHSILDGCRDMQTLLLERLIR